METLELRIKYAVMQRVNEMPTRVGTVIANNYASANKKALQLFNRRVWVERLT